MTRRSIIHTAVGDGAVATIGLAQWKIAPTAGKAVASTEASLAMKAWASVASR